MRIGWLQNENRLTYDEFGKYWKTHEITMKYGNFMHFVLEKTCSIIVVRKTYMGMLDLRGFSFFFFIFCLKVYWHFVCWVLYCVGPSSFFLNSFFFRFAKVCFKKRPFLISEHLKVKRSDGFEYVSNLSHMIKTIILNGS